MAERFNLGKVLVTLEGEHDSTRSYDKYCEVSSGGSSYVSKKAVPIGTPITDTTYWQKRASKGADGIDGTDGDDGLDAYQPFKGWYSSTSELNTSFGSPQVGDYAYIKGATANDPVSIYQCTTAGTWTDSGRTFNPSNNQEFASGEALNVTHIVDNLTSSSATDVLSAKQGKELKGQIDALGPKIDGVKSSLQNKLKIALDYIYDLLELAVYTADESSLMDNLRNAIDNITAAVESPTIAVSGSTLMMTCGTTGANIYYTTDGSTPTLNSTKYTSAITLPQQNVTYKAVAYDGQGNLSSVSTYIYEYDNTIVHFADSTIKAALVADSNINTDGDNEISLEEAAACASFAKMFQNNTTITSFDELQYFTYLYMQQSEFEGCSGLTSIVLNNRNYNNYCFKDCTSLESASFLNTPTIIPNGFFSGCSSLDDFTLPTSVENVKASAFQDCSNLVITSLHSGLTTIGNYAFRGCSKVAITELPSSVTSIGIGAFRACTGITSMVIPSGISTIPAYCFYQCSNLTKVKILNTSAVVTLTETTSSISIPATTTIYVDSSLIAAYRAAYSTWTFDVLENY